MTASAKMEDVMKKEKKQRAEKMYKKAVSIICMAVILALLSGSGGCKEGSSVQLETEAVSYTHLRAHET